MNIRFRDSEPDALFPPTLMQAIPTVSKDYVLLGSCDIDIESIRLMKD